MLISGLKVLSVHPWKAEVSISGDGPLRSKSTLDPSCLLMSVP